MRILVVTPYFYPHLGGSEKYIEGLYKAVLKANSSIKVDVLTYGYGKYLPVEAYGPMKIYRVKGYELLPNQFSIPNYFQLISLIHRLKAKHYDIINAHTRFFESSWWTPLVGKYFKSKTVLTDHCAYHPNHKCWLVKTVAYMVDKLGIPILGRFYSRITAVSQATKQFLKENGINKQIEIVPNSVNFDLFLGKKETKTIEVSFIGRNIRAKGAHLFEEVSKNLSKRYPQVRFNLVTNKSYKEVIDIFKRTSILVHPSLHHEGLPTVILEAGAAKCAVIATDRGGTREVVEDGMSGVIVQAKTAQIEEAVEKLILDNNLRKKLAQNLYQKVKDKYNWDNTAIEYINFLKKIQ